MPLPKLQTEAKKVMIRNNIDVALPENSAQGLTYPVVFSFTNMSNKLSATNIIINKNYPKGFVQTSDTCRNSLAPLAYLLTK